PPPARRRETSGRLRSARGESRLSRAARGGTALAHARGGGVHDSRAHRGRGHRAGGADVRAIARAAGTGGVGVDAVSRPGGGRRAAERRARAGAAAGRRVRDRAIHRRVFDYHSSLGGARMHPRLSTRRRAPAGDARRAGAAGGRRRRARQPEVRRHAQALDAAGLRPAADVRAPSRGVTRAVRSPLARALALSTALLVASLAAPSAARAAPLKIVVPDPDNLQYLSFWVAVGAGYFRDEGVELEPWIPPAPQATTQAVVEGKAEVAVLSPPMYLELIDRRVPVVLVANLLKNDAINLIVRRTVIESRKLSPSASLVDRLRGLHGLKIGIAPNPPRRLRALFASVGLDADRELQLVILSGPQQNAAFERGEVDALYAHTPYLEKALTDDGAMMWVNQSAGEVPSLATRQIH